MRRVTIWVEGVADQKFLADIICHWYGLAFDKQFKATDETSQIAVSIQKTDGISTFTADKEWEKRRPDFEDNQIKGIQNIVIVDADANVENRRKDILSVTEGMVSAETLYLWPDDRSTGDLETLLEQIIQPQHKGIFECWEAYEMCLKHKNLQYTTPDRKAKIYAYLEALLSKQDGDLIKELKRDYTNPDHWNLNAEQEPLKQLKTFLDQHLLQTNDTTD